jgi:hypothetical protein
MLVVNVTIPETTNCDHLGALIGAVFTDELGHRPRFERRADRAQFIRKVTQQHADEFTLAIPEAGEQLAFFFGREQVGRKSRHTGVGNFCCLSRSLTPGGLHGGLSRRKYRV